MERFTKLFESYRLIAEDCPVIIEKYVITKDMMTNRLLLQTKFKNVSCKNIIGVEVSIVCKDLMNNELMTIPRFMYQDMSILPNQSYGGDIVVFLDNPNTRVVDITCQRIIFSDRSIWENSKGCVFKDEPPFDTMLKEMDSSLADQLTNYELHYAKIQPQYIVKPISFGRLRRCVCGSYNFDNDQNCLECNHSIDFWKSITDEQFLKNRLDERLKIVEERRIEEEKARLEYEKQQEIKKKEKAEKRKKRKKRFKKVGLPIIIVSVIAIIAAAATFFYFIPKSHYDKAQEYMSDRKFADAAKEYEKADQFASDKEIKKAKSLIESGERGDIIDKTIKVQCENENILKVYLFPNVGRKKIFTPLTEIKSHDCKNDLFNFTMDEKDQDGNHYYHAKVYFYCYLNAKGAWSEINQVKNKKQFKDFDKLINNIHDAVIWSNIRNYLATGQLVKAFI